MKRIENIDKDMELIAPKMALKKSDWNKEEKEAIARCYFEVTKVSTGKGRSLDLGCGSCVSNAVVIVTNYAKAVFMAAMKEERQPSEEQVDEHLKNLNLSAKDNSWKKNHEGIDAKAEALGYKFAEGVETKNDKIAAIEKFIAGLTDFAE